MLDNKFIALVVLLATGGLVQAENGVQVAPEAPESTNTPPRLQVSVQRQGGPNEIPADRAYITVGTNLFAFLVPTGFRLENRDTTRVVLNNERIGFISLKILGSASQGVEVSNYRGRALGEFSGAEIKEEFVLSAGGGRGPAFDLNTTSGASRIAYISVGGSLIEFRMDATHDKFGQGLPPLNYLMQTFRASDSQGKLEATPLASRN